MGFIQGERIGNYRVECELGTTGSGLLLQVQHLVVPRRAIIKIRTELATDQPLVVQTLREACILEAVAHPGVPLLYEAGCLQDHRPWFAFEASSGTTLDSRLASGPLPIEDVTELVRDIAEVLEHAHHRGVIHRGLRPRRVLVTAGGRYPLCIPDWSEAIVHDATTPARRVVSEASRSYVAPELLRDGPEGSLIDGRVDVFSLGVIAHRALTGRLPTAPGLGAEPYAPSHERRPGAPRALTALIDSMLAFQRLDRPSASEVCAVVDRLLATASRQLVPLASASKTSPVAPGSPEDPVVLARRQQWRRPRWTPELRYAETAEVSDEPVAEGGPDDFTE